MVAAKASVEKPAPGEQSRRRYRSLDGVRGIAAFVVLICHAFLVTPALAQAYVDPNVMERWSPSWWASFSPLHLAWAGTEAVYLFFVLSGFVLTLPFARSGGGWAGYYSKRFLRLYLPVWGAFALAFLWLNLFPREFPPEASLWLQSHVPVLPPEAIRMDLLLYKGPGLSNSALWSLRFEVLFSLFLPLFILGGRYLPKLNLLKAVVLLGAIFAFADTGLTARFFLPMFGLGTLMAFERDRLAALAEGIKGARGGGALWCGLAIVALLLLNSYWTVRGLTTDPATLETWVPLSRGLIAVGACLTIFVAVESRAGWLEKPLLQWLGKRSFSLYLVHEPIVVSVAVLFGGTPALPLTLAVAVPVSLLVAEVFYRLVERPSQRLGRTLERRIEARGVRRGTIPGGVKAEA